MTLDKRDHLLSAILFLAMVLLSAAFTGSGVTGTFHDDGVYVSTTKALAEGRGYSLINFPGEPAQTKYPILFPLVLGLVWTLNPQFPSNIFALQMVSAVSAGLFLGGCYLYFVRFKYASRVVALSACVICLTIPGFDFFGGQVLSEMPFALGVLCCLWCLDSYCERTKHSTVSQIFVGIALAIPAMIRLIGLPIPFFGFALIWLRRLPVRIALCSYIVATGIALAPLLLGKLTKLQGPAATGLQTYQDNYVDWGLRLFMQCETAVILKNIQEILAMTTKILFCGIAQFSQPTMIYIAVFVLFGLIPYVYIFLGQPSAGTGAGASPESEHDSEKEESATKPDRESTVRKSGVSSTRNWLAKKKALPFVLASYILLVIAWPWPPFRFLMPILPYLALGFFMALHNVVIRFAKKDLVAQLCVALLAVSVSVANLSVLTPVIQAIQNTQIPMMMQTRNQPQWSSYVEVLEWIKTNTKESDTLCSTYDALTFLYTNRKCVRPYELNVAVGYYGQKGELIGTVDDLVANLKRYQVRYFVITPQPGYGEESAAYKLAKTFQAMHKDVVVPVFVSRDGRFFVLKIDGEFYR